ncbi:MAG: DoxX family protein [Bacteroidetes bacterium]|jgi:putative oxidoreductase|nr:DoxX family protein [Bacteroidota bacterium]MCL5034967.1 DoxX family protein [Bacteroidota bacterium]
MTGIIIKWQAMSPYFRSILRIAAAFTFTLHGTVKLFAFPAGMGPGGMTVHLFSQMGLAGILEAFGGVLLLLGLFTRPVAFILSGEMAVAFFQVHFPRGFWPVLSGGELAFLYCFVWFYLSTAGAGPWSLDAVLAKRRDPVRQELKA